MTRSSISLVCTLILSLPRVASAGQAPRPVGPPVTRVDLIAAEAARAATPAQLDLLRSGLRSPSPDLQRLAVRAMGRLERPDLVADIQPLLSAATAEVRGEAANALAQALGPAAGGAARAGRDSLVSRLKVEADVAVRGELCAALGRLPYDAAADVQEVERALVAETARTVLARSRSVTTASPLVGVRIGWGARVPHHTLGTVGALRGLEALVRRRAKLSRPSDATRKSLHETAASPEVMVRRLSMLILNLAGGADPALLERSVLDADEQVRRLAIAAPTASRGLAEKGLKDASPMVRYEALRAYGRRFQADNGCGPVAAAVRDASTTVALLALDLLGGACRPEDGAAEILSSQATGPTRAAAWHRPAHALVSLARVAPDRARSLLGSFVAAEPWFSRMYAARAAAQLGDETALRALAVDRSSNVREAALAGLSRLVKHAADPLFLEALKSEDPQLVIAAARALEATPDRDPAVSALTASLTRFTAADSDNSRDPRMAILDRLAELGSADASRALEPLLADPDPRVAQRAADVLSKWTGQPRAAAPRLRPPAAVPTQADLDRLARTTVRVSMEGGGSFEVALLPDLAPLTCARFVDLASTGYYNGLTFHRVEPNFVIQGGSPGASEYWGHPRFMRDEVGRAMQERGALGISTRGRDSGDAQIFIDLVDLPRLDHDYTVFGEVSKGMDVVDAILEGDHITAITITVSQPKGRR